MRTRPKTPLEKKYEIALGEIIYKLETRRIGLYMDGESQWVNPFFGELWEIAKEALDANKKEKVIQPQSTK